MVDKLWAEIIFGRKYNNETLKSYARAIQGQPVGQKKAQNTLDAIVHQELAEARDFLKGHPEYNSTLPTNREYFGNYPSEHTLLFHDDTFREGTKRYFFMRGYLHLLEAANPGYTAQVGIGSVSLKKISKG